MGSDIDMGALNGSFGTPNRTWKLRWIQSKSLQAEHMLGVQGWQQQVLHTSYIDCPDMQLL